MLFELRRTACAPGAHPNPAVPQPSRPAAHPAAVQHRGGLGEPRAVGRPPQPRAQLAARLAQDVVARQLGKLAERGRDEAELAAVQPREPAAQHAQQVRQHGAARRAASLVGRPAAPKRASPPRPPVQNPTVRRPDDGAERRASAARIGEATDCRPPASGLQPCTA